MELYFHSHMRLHNVHRDFTFTLILLCVGAEIIANEPYIQAAQNKELNAVACREVHMVHLLSRLAGSNRI
jgi:hypothetical protein